MTTPLDVTDEALQRKIDAFTWSTSGACDDCAENPCTGRCSSAGTLALLRKAVSDRAELARLRGQRCKTCYFAGQTFRLAAMECDHPEMAGGGPVLVPISINGQPFGCAGWKAKEPKP